MATNVAPGNILYSHGYIRYTSYTKLTQPRHTLSTMSMRQNVAGPAGLLYLVASLRSAYYILGCDKMSQAPAALYLVSQEKRFHTTSSVNATKCRRPCGPTTSRGTTPRHPLNVDYLLRHFVAGACFRQTYPSKFIPPYFRTPNP